jgi:hypothetical protein
VQLRWALLAAALAAVVPSGAHAAECPDGRAPRTTFGRRSEPDKLLTADKTVSIGSQAQKIRYFRLQIEREPGTTDQGVVVVKDDDLRVVDVFALKGLTPGTPVWTRRGAGNEATFRFVVPKGATIGVRLLRSLGMPAEADPDHTYYSLQVEGVEGYHPVYPKPGEVGATALAKRVADSVGFVHGSYEGGQQTWCCSAVAVDVDLLLTNWHCGGDAGMEAERYWSKDVCRQTIVDMSWDGDAESREYQCQRVVADPTLDLALLRVVPIDRAEPLVPLPMADADTETGAANLLHHPVCKAKQATESCHIEALGPTAPAQAIEFTHDCDSEGGSSGGPVFDDAGRMIGLHHAGFLRDPTTCNPLDKVNRGIRLATVKAFLTTARAALAQPGEPPK